ncbi:hypothetical protein BGI41_02085 [Methanobrevibacter sp. 87.7]|uniref:hypothetical protein n=1 Tax=Methanobrevibacter sp. 87.7 TaxID=387957 RepID=UPI000B4FDBCC|nr:hypothetical protein [Methanobrevibacter sp. 87.7]OWT33491.1 hypothetical protein BGI41_02085 [Methanobrevibacter sp. 87.7]
MVDSKNIKQIELSSFTTMGMSIYALLSVILAVLLFIVIFAMTGGKVASIALILIPVIVFGTILHSIVHFFGRGLLYNVFVKKLNAINFSIEDNEVKEIKPLPIALVLALISLVCFIIVYTLIAVFVPTMISSFLQLLMMSGQMGIAMILYNVVMLMLSPRIIISLIIASFVFPFLFVLIGAYCYNYIAPSVGGIGVELEDDGDLTLIKSFNPTKTALIMAIIVTILSVIVSVIMLIVNQDLGMSAVYNIISAFVLNFVGVFLATYFYNYLAPRIGEVKLNLEKEL